MRAKRPDSPPGISARAQWAVAEEPLLSRARLAGLLALLSIVPARAFSHGEAEWIQKDLAHGWCCGEHDCERAPTGAVVMNGGLYLIPSTNQSFANRGRPEDRVFPSIDLDYWWCKYPDGRVRCLFVPPLTW